MKQHSWFKHALSMALALAMLCSSAAAPFGAAVWAEDGPAARQEQPAEAPLPESAPPPEAAEPTAAPAPAKEPELEADTAQKPQGPPTAAPEPTPPTEPRTDAPAPAEPGAQQAPEGRARLFRAASSGLDHAAGTVDTGLAGVNLVNNPGFEFSENTFEAWGANLVQEVTDAALAHSGAKAVRVDAGQAGTAYAFSGLNAAFDRAAPVKAGMWVYLEDASDADRALIVLERKIGTGDTGAYNRTARPQAQTGWQRVELAGEAMSELCTEQVIKFEVAAGNAGAVYFDDAFVYTEAPESINWLRNPAFEDGNNAWSSYSTVDGGRSGRAVRLEAGSETLQASGWWGAGRPTYAGEQAMTLSVWAKSESGAGRLQLRAELLGKQDYSQEFDLPAGDVWRQYTLAVPQAEGVSEALLHIKAVQGTLLVDDARFGLPEAAEEGEDKTPGTVVTGQPGANAVQNPGFEQDGDGWGIVNGASVVTDPGKTHSGAKCVEITGAAALWNNLPGTQDANAATVYSAWLRLENAADADKVRLSLKRTGTENAKAAVDREIIALPAPAAVTGWQMVQAAVPLRSENDADGMVVLVDAAEGLAGRVYMDDVFVKEALPDPDPDLPDDSLAGDPDKQPGVLLPGQAGENLVQNSGFEEPDENHGVHWGLIGAAINTNKNYTHGGSASAMFEKGQPGGGAVFNVLPRTQDPNEATVLSAWVYLRNAQDAGKIHLRLKRNAADGTELQILDAPAPEARTGWQQVKLEVPESALAGAELMVAVVDVDSGLAGRVYVDDLFVKKSEKAPAYPDGYLTNPGFERVDAAKEKADNWGLMPDWNDVPGAVCGDTAHSGSYSVRIPQGGAERELLQSTNWIDPATTRKVDPSEPMLLTAWVKYENITGDGIWLRSERKSAAVNAAVQGKAVTGSSDGWVRLELYIPPNSEAFDECLVGLRVAPGKGTVWVDDMNLEPTEYREPDPETLKGGTEPAQRLYGADALQSGANWITNPGFEQGLVDWGTIGSCQAAGGQVHGGEKAMLFRADAHLWNNVAPEINKNAAFVLSFWVKLSAPSDAPFVQFYAARKDGEDELIRKYTAYAEPHDRWQQIVVRIPAEEYFATRHLVIGMDALAQTDPVYLDDFYLTLAKDNPQLDNYMANGSFELGDSGKDKWGAIPDWGNGIHIVSDVSYSGDRSMRIQLDPDAGRSVFQANAWGGAQQYPAEKNTILSVFLYSRGITGDGVTIKAERKYKEQLVGEPILSEPVTGSWSGWKLVELYLPATGEPVDDLIVGLETQPGTGTLYIDSWGLYLTDRPAPASAEGQEEPQSGATLKNPGMEQLNPDGTTTHWDVWPGDPAEGERNSYSSTEIKHSGERSVCIELVYSNPQAIYQYRVLDDNPFPFNESYVFSAWVKTEALSVVDGKGFKIGVKRRGADGQEYNQYESVPLGTYDWTKVEITVPKVDGVEIVQYDVIFDLGCGSGKVYFDDLDLSPADPAQAPATPALRFESEAGAGVQQEKTAAAAEKRDVPFWPFAAVGGLAAATLGAVGLAARRKKGRTP